LARESVSRRVGGSAGEQVGIAQIDELNLRNLS
jgi:hypothetical protein